jgi:hypothetical protein
MARWACATTAFALLAATGAAVAGSLTANVQVKVKLVSSSGVCGAIAAEPAVEVSCQPPGPAGEPAASVPPGGPLLPDAGQVPYQRVGVAGIGSFGVAKEPLPVYSVGTKITSWRIVQLDNSRYLELTIAW